MLSTLSGLFLLLLAWLLPATLLLTTLAALLVLLTALTTLLAGLILTLVLITHLNVPHLHRKPFPAVE